MDKKLDVYKGHPLNIGIAIVMLVLSLASVVSADTLLETITVPTNGGTIVSTTTLQNGVTYKVIASGTFWIGGPGDHLADAEYADFSNAPTSVFSNCGYSPSGTDFGIGINDLVNDNNKFPYWGTYNTNHVYGIDFVGLGAPINLNYHDCNLGDNSGSLTVKIYEAGNGNGIPEFPTVALPVIAVIGLMFLFQRRKGK